MRACSYAVCSVRTGERCKDSSEIASPFGLVRPGSSLYTMPKFCHGDGRDFKPIFGPRSHPDLQVKGAFLTTDENIGIPGLSPSVSRRLDSLTHHEEAKVWRRDLKGEPFFSSTKVTFW